jgi:hypothetical protein
LELRVGFYEFFAYTLAGIAYLFAATVVATAGAFFKDPFQLLKELGVAEITLIGIAGYIVGLTLDLIARKLAKRCFKVASEDSALRKLAARVPEAEAFANSYWPLALAELHVEKEHLVAHVDTYKAASILLRNVALAILSAGSALLVLAPFFASKAAYDIVGLGSIAFAIAALHESRRFDEWFYSALWERLIALRRFRASTKPATEE